jgi:hypothetical protein
LASRVRNLVPVGLASKFKGSTGCG